MTPDRRTDRPITLEGAIDLHCHFGPERFVEELFGAERHAVNAIEAAQEARDAGMRAIVLKGHEFATTGSAYLAQAAVPEVQVFSGICLDHPVGCLNPHAAEGALRNGAKFVWLPTLSARGSVPALRETGFGDGEGVRVLDADGELLPEVREIIALVQEYDAVLASGHIETDEQFAVARAFTATDRYVITHAMQEAPGVTPLSPAECQELAELGAVIELSAHSCMGDPAKLSRVVEVIERVGGRRAALSTDYGFTDQAPHPAAGFQDYVTALWQIGAPEAALREMTVDTPERVLGLR